MIMFLRRAIWFASVVLAVLLAGVAAFVFFVYLVIQVVT